MKPVDPKLSARFSHVSAELAILQHDLRAQGHAGAALRISDARDLVAESEIKANTEPKLERIFRR